MTDYTIKEITFEECLPLLKLLWPDKEIIRAIDNTLGMIKFYGRDLSNIKPRFWGAYTTVYNELIACTGAYMTSDTELRIRGTFCLPVHRKSGASKQLVLTAISSFPMAKKVYTFPRFGVEKFYESIGFVVTPYEWSEVYRGVRYAYKNLEKDYMSK